MGGRAPLLEGGLRTDDGVTLCVSEEVERLNGLRRAGYAWRSRSGTGGVSVDFPLVLNALRREAKEPFFVKGTDDGRDVCEECAWGIKRVVEVGVA